MKRKLSELVELSRRRSILAWKLALCDVYNRGPRFGQLWINGEVIELSREDYQVVKSALARKFYAEIEQIDDELGEENVEL